MILPTESSVKALSNEYTFGNDVGALPRKRKKKGKTTAALESQQPQDLSSNESKIEEKGAAVLESPEIPPVVAAETRKDSHIFDQDVSTHHSEASETSASAALPPLLSGTGTADQESESLTVAQLQSEPIPAALDPDRVESKIAIKAHHDQLPHRKRVSPVIDIANAPRDTPDADVLPAATILDAPYPRIDSPLQSPVATATNMPVDRTVNQTHQRLALQHTNGLRAPILQSGASLDAFTANVVAGSLQTHNIIISGNEGGLEVSRLGKQRELIGRIDGLSGAVLQAVVLPESSRSNDPLTHLRPLIACVVHGPCMASAANASEPKDAQTSVSAYHTTVEIYSLSSSAHVQTLYQSSPTPLPDPISYRNFVPPPPAHNICLTAAGQYLSLAVSESGEIFVFVSDALGHFNRIASHWTRCKDAHIPANGTAVLDDLHQASRIPILSLSNRWLAIVPPLLSASQTSAEGIVTVLAGTVSTTPSSFVSPSPPHVNCEVEGATEHSLLNRVTKQATQEVVRSAQWVGDQGTGILKSYWNRGLSLSTAENGSAHHGHTASNSENAFPPTHGQSRREHSTQSALVTIIDLHRHQNNFDGSALDSTPLATFNLDDGCSHLSFDPSGLNLLVSNHVGDANTIWDLGNIGSRERNAAHVKQDPLSVSNYKSVRRVVAFPRLSHSAVVGVQWSPNGRRVGILTSNGTIHLYEVPRHAINALVRSSFTYGSFSHGSAGPSPQQHSAPAQSWMNNVMTGWQTVQNQIYNTEADSLVEMTRKKLGKVSVNARNAGGRAVRQGYSSALESAHTLRHAQKNKIRLHAPASSLTPGSFRWLTGKAEGAIAVLDGGILCRYAVKSRYYHQGRRTNVQLDASTRIGIDETLDHDASVSALPPAVLGRLEPNGPHGALTKLGVHGFWTLGNTVKMAQVAAVDAKSASAPEVDKDTCPQHMPLHRHRHVDLFVFDEVADDEVAVRDALNVSGDDDWMFGLPLPRASRVDEARDVEV